MDPPRFPKLKIDIPKSPSVNSSVSQRLTSGSSMDLPDPVPNLLSSNELSPLDLLALYLKPGSVLSTNSSNAIANYEALTRGGSGYDIDPVPIGIGLCGEVFDMLGTGKVVKRAKRSSEREIRQEAIYLCEVRTAHISEGATYIKVPEYTEYVSEKNLGIYQQFTKYFPSVLREPRNLMVSERIFPVPALIRKASIALFCPDSLKTSASSNPINRQCLFRIYAGVRRPNPETPRPTGIDSDGNPEFSLWNYELTLDKLEYLSLPVSDVVQGMGESLALMHWRVQCDARDVEFVLGSSPKKRVLTGPELRASDPDVSDRLIILDFRKRTADVWLLDFNQVRSTGEDSEEDALNKMVEAFERNDPYYPKPKANVDQDYLYWEAFSTSYLETSKKLKAEDLARKFLKCLYDREKDRQRSATQLSQTSSQEGPPKGDPQSTGSSSKPSPRSMKKGGSRPRAEFQFP